MTCRESSKRGSAHAHGRVTYARAVALALAALIAACSGTQGPVPRPSPPHESVAAPWQDGRLELAAVPQAYYTAWSRADNRRTCALVALSETAATQGGTARVATFSGGWGVAYDQADLRSAFGVAGTGVSAADPAYNDWPHRLSWSDGSEVGYGPEGGSGPNQLAYLTIAGQECLYNIWSRLGPIHLEQLLRALRFVEAAGS